MKSPFGRRPRGARLERIEACPRWADGKFHNTHKISQGLKKGTTAPTVHEFMCGGQRRTPPGPLPAHDPRRPWERPPETGLRATWLGHSTVLLEIDGMRVLTDPVWGERASPVTFAGPRRFQPVPVTIAALPPLDLVIISHDHYDHLDYPSILELAKLEVPFVTSLGVGEHLESWGVAAERITELDWWESVEVGGLHVTACPSQHFSGRGIGSRNMTLWSSFSVRGPRHSFFFSGDTGLTDEFAEVRARQGTHDLVMLEVGAFHPAWGDIHLGPENALSVRDLLGGGAFLPVHWGTFNLAIHAWDEPAETLLVQAARRGARLIMPLLGDPTEPARYGEVDPWWRPLAAQGEGQAEGESGPQASGLGPRPESDAEGEAVVELPID